MSGNTFGVLFRVTTFGESHGKALGAVIDGCPPNLDLGEDDIQAELNRRKPGGHKASTSREEEDRVEILSGVFEGKTTGTPIALVIAKPRRPERRVRGSARRLPARPRRLYVLQKIRHPGSSRRRPRLGARDGCARGRRRRCPQAARPRGARCAGLHRGAGRHRHRAGRRDAIGANRLLCPDPEAAKRMEQKLEEARSEGDSLGGIVEVRVTGCPAGLGEPVFDKIDADLAGALMGIGTVKGVEIGAGFEAARMKGSRVQRPHRPRRVQDQSRGRSACGDHDGAGNRDPGGLQAHRLHRPGAGNDRRPGKPGKIAVRGRHDACVIPRIIPVCEAMVCLVIADHLLRQKRSRKMSSIRETRSVVASPRVTGPVMRLPRPRRGGTASQ